MSGGVEGREDLGGTGEEVGQAVGSIHVDYQRSVDRADERTGRGGERREWMG